jgi:hypothetical protein
VKIDIRRKTNENEIAKVNMKRLDIENKVKKKRYNIEFWSSSNLTPDNLL